MAKRRPKKEPGIVLQFDDGDNRTLAEVLEDPATKAALEQFVENNFFRTMADALTPFPFDQTLAHAVASFSGVGALRETLAGETWGKLSVPTTMMQLPDISTPPAWLRQIEPPNLVDRRPTPVFSPIPPSVEEPSVAEVEERCGGEIEALYAIISDLRLALEQSEKENWALRRESTLRRLPGADEEYPQLPPEYFGKN